MAVASGFRYGLAGRADFCDAPPAGSYSMAPIKGRRTIARVTKLFRISAITAYEEIGDGGPGAESYRGGVCVAIRRLPNRMFE